MPVNEDRLVEEHRRESPATQPSIFWEVVYPPLAAALATYLLFALFYGSAVGQGMAGGMMLIVLGWRLWRFDRNGRGVHIVETRRYVEPETTRREWAPVIQDNGEAGNGGNRWRIGNWYWSENEWRRLALALSGGKVTREALESVTLDNGQRMFPNPTGRLNEYKRIFRQMGWTDHDDILTPAARAWLAERNLPLPSDDA